MALGKIKTSDLKCRIDIKRKTETPDGMGGHTISYTTFASVWAKIENWKGRENYRAERTEGLVYQRVVIRAGTAVQNDDVVVFQNRTMPVKYINNLQDGANRYIEMLVIEGDPAGGTGAA